jgi:hypothetical protein
MLDEQNEKARETDATPSPGNEAEPAYSEDGVDLTLIRWFLSLTPTERLRHLEDHIRAIWKVRRDNSHLGS